jgi:hypothetical protein
LGVAQLLTASHVVAQKADGDWRQRHVQKSILFLYPLQDPFSHQGMDAQMRGSKFRSALLVCPRDKIMDLARLGQSRRSDRNLRSMFASSCRGELIHIKAIVSTRIARHTGY